VPVKSWEEAEAMLSRQIFAPALARVGDRNAPRFASKNILAFANRHREASLDEFVRRAQPTHTPPRMTTRFAMSRYSIRKGATSVQFEGWIALRVYA
jgi:hypothetical protein